RDPDLARSELHSTVGGRRERPFRPRGPRAIDGTDPNDDGFRTCRTCRIERTVSSDHLDEALDARARGGGVLGRRAVGRGFPGRLVVTAPGGAVDQAITAGELARELARCARVRLRDAALLR